MLQPPIIGIHLKLRMHVALTGEQGCQETVNLVIEHRQHPPTRLTAALQQLLGSRLFYLLVTSPSVKINEKFLHENC
jgi:hypothetical protein